MTSSLRWTTADLELLPDNGTRYEIIEGELYSSARPHFFHQYGCGQAFAMLNQWGLSGQTGLASIAPGIIFAEDDDVAPDVVWVSKARLAVGLDAKGKLRAAPELVIEILSPGRDNERRDRETKLKLYSRRGVLEYWIIDWQLRQVEIYRREQAQLQLLGTFHESDNLESPHLPGLRCPVAALFEGLPGATTPAAP